MNRTYYVYMLRCSDDSYYTGHTENLDHRVASHQQGDISGYTARRRPIRLVWSQAFLTRLEAIEAERQIKGWTRAKKEALIHGNWPLLQKLSHSNNSARPEPVEGRAEPPRIPRSLP